MIESDPRQYDDEKTIDCMNDYTADVQMKRLQILFAIHIFGMQLQFAFNTQIQSKEATAAVVGNLKKIMVLKWLRNGKVWSITSETRRKTVETRHPHTRYRM